MACPPRPSASGASAAQPTARTTRAARISCPGKQQKKSGPLSAPCGRATGFPLDHLTFVVIHFLPHLNRDAVYRILKAEGLGRLSPVDRSRGSHSSFKEYDLGFVHVDVKHLPKLRTSNGESRKRYL